MALVTSRWPTNNTLPALFWPTNTTDNNTLLTNTIDEQHAYNQPSKNTVLTNITDLLDTTDQHQLPIVRFCWLLYSGGILHLLALQHYHLIRWLIAQSLPALLTAAMLLMRWQAAAALTNDAIC